LIWAPWLSRQDAEDRVVDQFNAAWEGVVDGCGFNCAGCGVTQSKRTLLGFKVEIEYACGLIPEDTPEYHQIDRAFVSVLGIVTGLDVP
jgi:hypothetical protein